MSLMNKWHTKQPLRNAEFYQITSIPLEIGLSPVTNETIYLTLAGMEVYGWAKEKGATIGVLLFFTE